MSEDQDNAEIMKKEELEARDKARLIKEALKITDDLANLDITDIDDIEYLIEKAEKLKRDRNWKIY